MTRGGILINVADEGKKTYSKQLTSTNESDILIFVADEANEKIVL
ncbi:MAG: hypothetical protein WAM95_14550 [Bacillus sp. (in: firmicutes)]